MSPEQISLRGEAAYRCVKNFARLEDRIYTPEAVFADATHHGGWPADMEGRVMLAITQLGRLTHREPAYSERFFERLEGSLNALGYRGAPLNDAADEQSLSGHNWLVRALLEHHLWRRDERSMHLARRIVENLYLPLCGRYADYPIEPAARTMSGAASGNLDGQVLSGFKTSTDIGCAFIPLDALSQYYELTGDARVALLIEEMIRAFSGIDFIKLSMQTHATLSATRGILRHHRTTKDPWLLELAAHVFDLYMAEGMSECYANHNWFGRPQWTEPCAIVDSYIVAMELFSLLGDVRHLDAANRILYTALWSAQRKNGGFGCDSCPGAGDNPLMLRQVVEEAYWCCSMRGAEGFYSAATHSIMPAGGKLVLTNLMEGMFRFDDAVITVRTGFPYEGDLRIRIEGAPAFRTLCVYTPIGSSGEQIAIINNKSVVCAVKPHLIHIELPAEDSIEISLTLPLILDARPPVNRNAPKNTLSLWHGVLMLGRPDDSLSLLPDLSALRHIGRARYAFEEITLEPVCARMEKDPGECMQVLFPVPDTNEQE